MITIFNRSFFQNFFKTPDFQHSIDIYVMPLDIIKIIFKLAENWEVKNVSKEWNKIIEGDRSLKDYFQAKRIEKVFTKIFQKKLCSLYNSRCFTLLSPSQHHLTIGTKRNICSTIYHLAYRLNSRGQLEAKLVSSFFKDYSYALMTIHGIYHKMNDKDRKAIIKDQDSLFMPIDEIAIHWVSTSTTFDIGVEFAIDNLNQAIASNKNLKKHKFISEIL